MPHDFDFNDLDELEVDESALAEQEAEAGDTEVGSGEYLAALMEVRPHHNEEKGSLGFWVKMLVNKNTDAVNLGWDELDQTFEWESYVYFGKVNGVSVVPQLSSQLPAIITAFGGEYEKLRPFAWKANLSKMIGTVAKANFKRQLSDYWTDRNGYDSYELRLSYINPTDYPRLNIGEAGESDDGIDF